MPRRGREIFQQKNTCDKVASRQNIVLNEKISESLICRAFLMLDFYI